MTIITTFLSGIFFLTLAIAAYYDEDENEGERNMAFYISLILLSLNTYVLIAEVFSVYR